MTKSESGESTGTKKKEKMKRYRIEDDEKIMVEMRRCGWRKKWEGI